MLMICVVNIRDRLCLLDLDGFDFQCCGSYDWNDIVWVEMTVAYLFNVISAKIIIHNIARNLSKAIYVKIYFFFNMQFFAEKWVV